MSLITPRTPPGVQELLPREQLAFQRMLDTIRSAYERFGFVPVETPVFESVDVLLTKSGGETEKQIYFVQSTGSREQNKPPDLALRFDLTVPLARYVAEHEPQLVFPFRRYQIQRVYRGERAQKGRFREFYQCDIDVIGKDTLAVAYDAEIPAIIHHVFQALQVGRFTIQLNNRKVLKGILEQVGVHEQAQVQRVLREVDKLDKVGRPKVVEALGLPDVGLDAAAATKLLELLESRGRCADILAMLRALPSPSESLQTGIAELHTVVSGLAAFGVPESSFRINLSIARGLDYYTGTIYETFLDELPEFGSVCSGGRYDNLASHYTKSRLPGVGISIGASRLFQALLERGVIQPQRGGADVLVTQMDPALSTDYAQLASLLRHEGIPTELYLEPAKLPKQLKYADRAGIPIVLLLGQDEQSRGVVTLKDLRDGQQHTPARAEVAAAVRKLLGGGGAAR